MPWYRRSTRQIALDTEAEVLGLRAILLRIENSTLNQEDVIMALPQEFEDLKTEVAANTDQGQSATIALERLAAIILANAEAATTLEEAKASARQLAATIKGDRENLAKAILRTDGDPTNDPAPFDPSANG